MQQNEESIEPAKASVDALALVHELQVHQTELEMQNEELKRLKLETEIALERYSDLYDFSPIGLVTLDEKRHILEVNIAGAELLGVKKHNLLNKHFGLFIAQEDRPSFDAFYNKTLESSTRQTCELSLLRGEVPTVYARIEGIATSGLTLKRRQCRIAISDITERKRMEGALQEKQEELEVQAEELVAQNEELRVNNEDLAETTKLLQESEVRFRATYEQAAVGIEMLNLDGRFLRGNAMLSEILGYSQKELQCLNFASITYPDDLVRELPLLEDLLARRIGHYTIEKRYLRKDGQGVWVRVTSSLANVQEPYRISIIEDITERKQAEDALQEAKDHLEMRVKERTSELEQANARLQEEITERNKVEEALRTASAYNRSLIEASLDSLVTIGPMEK